MRAVLTLGLIIIAPAVAIAQPAGEWRQLAEEDGMRIEGRPVPGTALREVRLTTRSPLSPEAIFRVVWDVSDQHEYVPNVKELRVLQQSDDERLVYERVRIPVVQDRDYTLRLTRQIDPAAQRYVIHAEGASDRGPPPRKGVVRMTRLWSTFTLEPAPGGGTNLTYVSFGDPAGKIPAWLARAADVRGPRDFVRAFLRRAAEKR